MDGWQTGSGAMAFRTLTVGPFENKVYVVRCVTSDQAVIIDAAAEPDVLLGAVADVAPVAILTTHGHWDHVGAVDVVRGKTGIPFRMHPADARLVDRAIDEPLSDGERIPVGEITVEVLHTPGHTPGSCCFLVDGVLFTGDTLFPGGPGATRFEYSSFDTIIDSLETRLFTMPDATPFYPGHGADSTIGTERPHLPDWIRRRW